MDKLVHQCIVGKLGSASKTIVFKEDEFNKDLAPANGVFENLELNGVKFVRMTYHYKN